MKKISIVTVTIVSSLAFYGCSKPNNQPTPTHTPTPVVSSSTNTPRPPMSPSHSVAPTETSEAPEHTATPPTLDPATSDAAAPPATQFAQRWGKAYPDVQEFQILRAANDTCKLIGMSGNDWAHDPQIKAGIEAIVTNAGMKVSDSDEFAQDASQNYCASMANPT